MIPSRLLASVLLLCGPLVVQATPEVRVAPDQKSGVYELGTSVTWTIDCTDKGAPVAGSIGYSVRKGGLTEIAAGTVDLREGKAQVKAARNDPGTLLLTTKFKPVGSDKEISALGGAVFAPDKITRSALPPADFDAFWKSKIAELAAVPLGVQFEPIDAGDPALEYFKITLNNVRGAKIHGQLAKPRGKTALPALLQVQWAGVYPLNREWVLGQARYGWLALNISAHDLPIDEKESFYTDKDKKELNDYPGIGNDDRETSYFLRMFLSCHRAVEYLTQHPDWNKKVLIVHGGSQGGYQALVTAGLHPAVTAVAANVPAGCDHTGKQAGRLPGWPDWAARTWQGKNETKMLTTARYFDAMNFASRIKCPALVGLGLVDPVCPAEGVLAACNQLQGQRTIVIMPRADHGGDHKAYYDLFGLFLEKQRQPKQE